ncbi:C40 family peptidase [Micromonospora chalcea]|uniref:C40 family peptidase n=1 Tax=Micromonospora chalcea TaxID=1874 RepID=UPI003320F58D
MSDSTKARRRRGRQPVISPVLRPALWSALLGAVAAAALATPAWADPLPDTVPSTGSRPQVTGPLQLPGSVPGLPGSVPGVPGVTVPGLPGGTTGVTNPADGPLIAQINQLDAQVGLLGEEMLRIKGERDAAQAELTQSAARLKEAQDALTRAQENAKSAAADAVKADAALPPGEFGASLRDFANLQRITRGDKAEGATTSVTGELLRATNAERIAREAHDSAQRRATEKAAEFTRAETDLRKQETTLVALRKENAAKLLEIERLADAAEQQLGSSYVVNQSIDGLAADPKALAAVRYALAQLGDPYLWAAEGPDRFDCSGLVLASYRSAGYKGLPRVAKDQYYATRSRTVSPNALLPGDLLFFASSSSWTSIHHVAMYIGNGKMVEAPRTGDVVKISVVRWSRLYAATRVIGAVAAPPATPAPPPPVPTTPPPSSPTPKPTPTTPKPTPTTPRPTPTTPRPTTPTPDPTTSSPTPSTPPSPPEEPTPTPSESKSAAPSTSAAPSSSSVAPSRSTSASASASASGSAD